MSTENASATESADSAPFSAQREELPEVIVGELRKAIRIWDGEAWSQLHVRRATALFLEKVGAGVSPREAFREASIAICRPERPYHELNILARRLGLSAGTHNLICRLSTEYGDTYTSFIRGIVETWAERHREMVREFPERDVAYFPAAEDNG